MAKGRQGETSKLRALAERLRPLAARGVLQHFYLAPTLPQAPLSHRQILDAWRSWAEAPGAAAQPLHLYLHIPFCAHKCRYCIYHSQGDFAPGELSAYLARLQDELDAYREIGAARPCDTFYLGGGTPTVLSEAQLASLLDRVHARFRFRPGGERAFECNPLSLTPAKARLFARFGLNRASFGVQTLRRTTLAGCNRGYQTERMVRRCIETLRTERFFVNADLIHGLDGGSLSELARTARRLLDWGATQITVYSLSPYTPEGVGRARGLPMDELGRALARRVELRATNIQAHPTALGITATGTADDLLSEEGMRERRAVRYSDASPDPFSLLGLGPTARGSIFGKLRYQFLPYPATTPFSPGARLAAGRFLEPDEEQRRYVVGQLEDARALSPSRYRTLFGEPLAARFGAQMRALRRAGWLRREPAGYVLAPPDALGRFAACLVFVSEPMRQAVRAQTNAPSPAERSSPKTPRPSGAGAGRRLLVQDRGGAAVEVELVAAAPDRPVFFAHAGLGFFVPGNDFRPDSKQARLLERFSRLFARAARQSPDDVDALVRRLLDASDAVLRVRCA